MQLPPPPLSDAWGNYALRGFADNAPPEAVSWLPSTPGWQVLLLLLAALLARQGWRHWQRRCHNRYRRLALKRLDAIARQQKSPQQRLFDIANLLKATALQVYRRDELAALSGDPWVVWLNQSAIGEAPFPPTVGNLLARSLYRADNNITDAQLAGLVAASRRWILKHRGIFDA